MLYIIYLSFKILINDFSLLVDNLRVLSSILIDNITRVMR